MSEQVGQQIYLFDTTLRDGQQCPGAGMSFEKNLEYAQLVRKLGIDVVEAGFPAASSLDFEIVRTIAELYAEHDDAPIVAALCQLRAQQIERTIEALQPALRRGAMQPRLHVYVPVDPNLMQASLGDKFSHEQILQDLEQGVSQSVSAGLQVEFSPEGYSRMAENFDFVTDLIETAVAAGAEVINCPDTIGGACRFQGEEYFPEKMKRHADLITAKFPEKNIIWSVHCHNDFGLALANSVNGVVDGPATQIEGCINGIGERAGNAALEQVILLLDAFSQDARTEQKFFTKAKVEHLGEVCDFVSREMLPQQAHSPVSGANAARHSSGGHTNAVLSNPLVYQPFDPRRIGVDISLSFGPLSGGNHAKSVIEKAGYLCEDSEKAAVAQHIKEVFSDRRKGITDQELLSGYFDFRSPIRVEEFDYSRSKNRSSVSLSGRFFDKEGLIEEEYEGRDSALAALKKLTDRHITSEIVSHESSSEGNGINAVSLSKIVLSDGDARHVIGEGRDQDIELSAMKALIAAVNLLFIESNYRRA